MIQCKICGLLFFLIIISTNAKSFHRHTKRDTIKPFSLDEVISDNYTASGFNGTWISGTEFLYRIDDQLHTFDAETKTTKFFLNISFPGFNTSQFSLSPNKNYLLIKNLTENVYRHSTLSQISIYDIKNKSFKQLQKGKLLSTAIWVPKSNSLVYVLKNNIYHYDVKYDKHRQLTHNGNPYSIYNGVPDWVYEEEVLATDTAMWISPDGEQLAFATFNDREVPEAVILKYGKPGDLKNQYPREEKFRYPKAGTNNPNVTLNLVDLADHGSSVVPLHTPVDIVGSNPILYAVGWLDAKTVVATWTNRIQNHSQIVSYALNGEFNYLLSQNVEDGWLLYSNVAPIYYNNNFLIIKSQSVNNKSLGCFPHLTRYRLLNNVLSNEVDLTPSTTWVSSILGISDLKRVVYYLATPPNEPAQKHLYEVSLNLDDSHTSPKCISCEVKTPEGNNCLYVSSVDFSTDFSYYTVTCTGPDPAVVNIYNYTHSELYTWNENLELRHALKEHMLPEQRNLIINSYGFEAHVRMFLPDNFNESNKYPLLVNVYAGPESQRIIDNFAIGLQTYMTTNRNVVYALIDGRGSSSKGTAMMYSVYRNLGNYEIKDQIYVTSQLQKKYSWIDKHRTGIWGWSYGGYATAMVLTNDIEHQIFKCGISVAPVINWIYYDSVYTERYMGLPTLDDNFQKYERNSVLRNINNLRYKKFMLIHGTGDDNVHFQQSMALTKALAEADVIFDQVTYPDEAHHLIHVKKHLYHTMDKFWSECFGYDEESQFH